eukprot:1244111-Pyramimonas_sp.AAC.1
MTSLKWQSFKRIFSSEDLPIADPACEWEFLPEELHSLVLAMLTLDDDRSVPDTRTRGTLRLVCHRWRDSHDAVLTELNVPEKTEDEALRALLGRFTALTAVNLDKCINVTDAGFRALGSLSALTSLDLANCPK